MLALSASSVNNLMSTYTGDLSGCLSKCSDNGACITLKSGLVCACKQYFTGKACEVNLNPCAQNPCLNDGACILHDDSGILSFRCDCPKYYNGKSCESKENICLHVTCSNHGYCFDNSSIPTCKCLKYYYGDNCEFKEAELNKIKRLIINCA